MSADWCEDLGSVAICGTEMVEHHRDSIGIRWCFHHRRHEEFAWVVYAPKGLSYYGPTGYIEGLTSECTDLFPGWTRELIED